MSTLSLLLCFALFAAAALGNEILVTFGVPSSSKHSAGLYWAGNDKSPRISTVKPWFGNSDSVELLVNVMGVGSTQSEQVFSPTSFVIRSADLTSRMRVTIGFNDKGGKLDKDRPYTISFVNLSVEDRHGPFPLELQHSNAGYVWIDPSEVVEHITGPNHIFTVRDKQKQAIFSVIVNGPVAKEL